MLHGKVEVNGVAVGYWEAKNIGRVMNDVCKYECSLYYRNNEGHPTYAEGFEVIHFQRDGAVGLASTVLRHGLRKLKGYPPGQEKAFPL